MKSKYLKTAIKAAKAAGKISSKSFNKEIEISYKDKYEIVTNVDKECEEKIIKIINSKFPDHNIWSEERDETLKKSDYRWVIDPIDGTAMFAHGVGTYGISIALEYKGKTIVAVNYFPELKKLYYAEKGKGSFMNGKPIHVSKKKSNVPFCFANSNLERNPNISKTFTKNYREKKITVRDLGSTALHLSLVAEGKADMSYSYNLKPGDVSSGLLLIREAGGKVINDKGKDANSSDEHIISYSNVYTKKDVI